MAIECEKTDGGKRVLNAGVDTKLFKNEYSARHS